MSLIIATVLPMSKICIPLSIILSFSFSFSPSINIHENFHVEISTLHSNQAIYTKKQLFGKLYLHYYRLEYITYTFTYLSSI